MTTPVCSVEILPILALAAVVLYPSDGGADDACMAPPAEVCIPGSAA